MAAEEISSTSAGQPNYQNQNEIFEAYKKMAEAIVEENPIVLNKFFCHKCGVEIPRVLDVSKIEKCLYQVEKVYS